MLGTLLGIFYVLSHYIVSFLGSDENKYASEIWGFFFLRTGEVTIVQRFSGIVGAEVPWTVDTAILEAIALGLVGVGVVG